MRVLRATSDTPSLRSCPRAELDAALVFSMVLRGSISLAIGAGPRERLGSEDVFVVPGGSTFELGEPSPDFELLELVLHRR